MVGRVDAPRGVEVKDRTEPLCSAWEDLYQCGTWYGGLRVDQTNISKGLKAAARTLSVAARLQKTKQDTSKQKESRYCRLVTQ